MIISLIWVKKSCCTKAHINNVFLSLKILVSGYQEKCSNSSLCRNNAACHSKSQTLSCVCRLGFKGTNCSESIYLYICFLSLTHERYLINSHVWLTKLVIRWTSLWSSSVFNAHITRILNSRFIQLLVLHLW